MVSETGGHDVYPTPCRDLCPRQHPGQQPENQLAELRKYVQAQGWSAHEYTDQGISGAKEKRPALDALIRDAKRRKFDVLACWRLDRFGRSLKHLVTLLDELQVLGIAFVSLAEGIDATTPAGKLQMHILAAIAEFERARIAERVTAGLARARANGQRLGQRPHRITAEALARTDHLSVRRAAAELGIPRSVFDQDLLYSFGAFMTICQVSRNDAEQRVGTLARAGWTAPSRTTVSAIEAPVVAEEEEAVDLERLARDQIVKLIGRKFKSHEMTRLVDAILKSQGYTTLMSPPGPDKDIDILAAPGPLGFGRPRICVQVKSQESPLDLPTLNQLIGSMQNVQADQGLLVAWGGFKASIDK